MTTLKKTLADTSAKKTVDTSKEANDYPDYMKEKKDGDFIMPQRSLTPEEKADFNQRYNFHYIGITRKGNE